MSHRKDTPPQSAPLTASDPLAFTPVPRQRMRRRGWSAARQREFIDHLVETGSVRAACRRMGVGEHQVYVLRNHPEGGSFRKAWEAALDMGIQRIEDVAMDRALNGVEEPVYSYGELIGTRIKHNDRLLMFILRNRAPKRWAAGGGSKPFNAVSETRLKQLKKQWRSEWEAQQPRTTSAEVRASIDRKIEEIRLRIEKERPERRAALSAEAYAAFAHFIALRDRDLAAIGADARTVRILEVNLNTPSTHFDPPEVPALPVPKKAEEENWHPPEGWQRRHPREPKPPKTEWTLKDESFDP